MAISTVKIDELNSSLPIMASGRNMSIFLVTLESMYTKSQILNILKEKKGYLQKRYPISELGIFGSYSRGDFDEKSDIDILVDFNGKIDGFEYIRLAHELEDTFNQKVDVVSRRGIKPQYLPYIEKSLINV